MSEKTAQFPIGKFVWPESLTPEERARNIERIAAAPALMRAAALACTPEELDKPYREGGWTARQVIHHVADSHMNGYIRTKLAVTEEEPLIKPYDQPMWALTSDVATSPIECSLQILDGLHVRWVQLLRGVAEGDWKRAFRHPEIGLVTLEKQAALYAWHGEHHAAHVRSVHASA